MAQGQDLIVVKMPGFVRYQPIPGPTAGDLETMEKTLRQSQANGLAGSMLAVQPGDLNMVVGTTGGRREDSTQLS